MRKIQNQKIKIAVIAVVSAAILYAIISVIDNIGLIYVSVISAVNFILSILSPVLIGFVIAFLLNRPSNFFARLFSRIRFLGKHLRMAEVLGVIVSVVLLIVIISLFMVLLVPGIIESIGGITNDIPNYARSINNVLSDLSRNESISQVLHFIGIDTKETNSISSIISAFWTEITAFVQSATQFLFGFIVNTGLFLYNFLLGLFFSLYMLLFKNQLKRQLGTLSQNVFRRFHYKLMFVIDIANEMFYRFIVGKGICSIVVGILTFAVCTILGFKYSPLISIIIAVTNMIPTLGPFIGAIPALLLSLLTAPIYTLYMLIIIIGLQIIDGNVLGPRVLGNTMGLNGFWIMFSIIVMGALFGVTGMLIAAPIFAMIRILIKNWIYHRKNGALEGEEELLASKARFNEWATRKKKLEKK